jgi:fructose-1,6-bisphosphatase II / sedoheptulose-1,7-bisphosphatase
MLDGVTVKGGFVSTHTVVMDSASRTVRRIRMTHPV